MNITFNGNTYTVGGIILHAKEGVRISIEKMTDLIELDTAPTHPDNSMIVAAVGTQYKVLVKPAEGYNQKTVVRLLSKPILKKCLVDTKYVPSVSPREPAGQEPWTRRPERPQYASDRPGTNRPRFFNR